ncbi:putative plastoglobular protein [Helianthus annuus]|nr:putative plastoglobular protein [Helianthus annuus]
MYCAVLFPNQIFLSLYLPTENMSTAISSPPAYSQIIVRTFNPSLTYLKSPNIHRKTAVGVFLHKKSGGFRCNCSSTPGGDPAPGENESKQVLDAFFLGKAFAEALNERIESTVGEFLSTVGRLQAEQQKQVQEFQDEVLERAKKAKEKAAREAMEAQGLVPKSTTSYSSSPTVDEPQKASAVVDEPTHSSSSGSNDQSPNNGSPDPLLGISIDD